MRILVDMDGIIVNLLDKWISGINEAQSFRAPNDTKNRKPVGQVVTREDITTFEIHNHVDMGVACYEIIKQPGFFDDLPPMRGAIHSMNLLRERGHEVLIASSPAGPDSARAKLEWLERHLDWDRHDVFLCHHKELIATDVIIDDRPSTLARCAEIGIKTAAIAHPYNTLIGYQIDCYAHGYLDTETAWAQILNWIEALEASR